MAESQPGPSTGDESARYGTPFEALGVIAQTDVLVTPRLMHVEMFTMRGLLTVLWHQPADGEPARRVAVVACGGAMGGLLGPADALYHRLGEALAALGVPMLRVGYRRPNDLDTCVLDVAATVQLACATGADRVVVIGHSFGGAVAVRVGVIVPDAVAGVVTLATQSAGCEIAAGLQDRPLLAFHGDRDEILPVQCSEVVIAIAGGGDLQVIPGDGHLLARSGPIIWDRLRAWLPATFGLPSIGTDVNPQTEPAPAPASALAAEPASARTEDVDARAGVGGLATGVGGSLDIGPYPASPSVTR